MNRRGKRSVSSKQRWISILALFLLISAVAVGAWKFFQPSSTHQQAGGNTPASSVVEKAYNISQEEKDYLKRRFEGLVATNAETIGYVYAPGTQLDEPIVQTGDNATYLEKTFEGEQVPYLGAVFMDTDNTKDFSDRLTWLFAHARGSNVEDHRMFNDVNYYDNQSYFEQHPYVVIETPERKYYYQAMAMVIVPEDTAFYRTEFKDDADFTEQLQKIYDLATVKSKDIKIRAKDRYLVLSTCREEDETIRANLYLRQIPDEELTDFLAAHKNELTYQATR